MKSKALAERIAASFLDGQQPAPDDVVLWGEPGDVPEERRWKSIRMKDFQEDAFFIVDCSAAYQARVFGLGLLLALKTQNFDLEAYKYFLRPLKSGTEAPITSTSKTLMSLLNTEQRELFLEFCAYAAARAEGTTRDFWARLLGPSGRLT